MFGFKKKEQKKLLIKMEDVFEIIKSDYEKEMTFELIEFCFKDKIHIMGSCIIPHDAEDIKENIKFVLNDKFCNSIKEFQQELYLNESSLFDKESIIEVTKAGIINGEVLLKSPWGERRLAEKAVNL